MDSAIQNRLLQTGDWDRLKAILAIKLTENGWSDDIKHRCKGT